MLLQKCHLYVSGREDDILLTGTHLALLSNYLFFSSPIFLP